MSVVFWVLVSLENLGFCQKNPSGNSGSIYWRGSQYLRTGSIKDWMFDMLVYKLTTNHPVTTLTLPPNCVAICTDL